MVTAIGGVTDGKEKLGASFPLSSCKAAFVAKPVVGGLTILGAVYSIETVFPAPMAVARVSVKVFALAAMVDTAIGTPPFKTVNVLVAGSCA